MKPKISVITIVSNNIQGIEDTIKSVIWQDYDNFEYIIIDGASTDGTIDVINKYRDHVDVFVSEPDCGISDAFNKGIQRSSGDLIGIVNSGDMFSDQSVLSRIAAQFDPKIDIYRGHETIQNPNTNYEYILYPTLSLKRCPEFFHICHMAMYLSRSAVEKYGLYSTSYKIAMDKELIYRYLRNGATTKAMDVNVGIFTLGGKSQQQSGKRFREIVRIMKENGAGGFTTAFYSVVLFTRGLAKSLVSSIAPDLMGRIRKKSNQGKVAL